MLDIPEYNPFHPDHVLDPHSIFARLRARAPVSYCSVLQSWLILGHEAICRVLGDPGTFSSRNSLPSLANNPPEVTAVLAQCTPDDDNMTSTDPPRHGRLRALVQAAFTHERLAGMARHVRAWCEQWLETRAAKGHSELVTDFIAPLILSAGGRFMGIEPEDQPHVPRWLGAWLILWDPTAPLEAKLRAANDMVEFDHYLATLLEKRRREPKDDTMSILAHSRASGLEPLTTTELINIVKPMVQAAFDVAASTIANGLLVFLRDPALAARLRRQPSLIPQAYQEAMRVEGPVTSFCRLCLHDTDFGGIVVPANSTVFVCVLAGNRDPAVFPSPDVFDMQRAELATKSLAYGAGIHKCLGGPLGHLQGCVVAETLLDRLPRLRLAPEFRPDYIPGPVFRQLTRLDVVCD